MSTTAKKQIKILVVTLSAHGHINACHGLCEELIKRGHEVTFLLDPSFAGRLTRYGFKEYIVNVELPQNNEYDSSKEFWPQFIEKNAHRFARTPIEQCKCFEDRRMT